MELVHESVKPTLKALWEGRAPWPLLLHGSVGAGKTCIALCLLDRTGGSYRTLAQFCRRLAAAQRGELSSSNGIPINDLDVWEFWEEVPLGVLDEIGLRAPSASQYETLQEAIDRRTGYPLILISNLAPGELARVYDDRIVSRCCAGTVVELRGPDRRLIRLHENEG